MIDSFGSTIGGSPLALLAVDVAVKATVLLALAFGCHAMLGRRRAVARSALWNATLVGLLILPAAGLASPRIGVVSLPGTAAARPEAPTPAREVPSVATAPEVGGRPASPGPIDRPASGPSMTDPVVGPTPDRRVPSPIERPAWRPGVLSVATGLYLAIATLLVARLAASLIAVDRLRKRCLPVEDAAWAESLDHWRARLGIGRRVPLLASARVSIPVVVGWPRPAILLPEALVGRANPGLIDAVLLHELGHVRRGDFGWNVVRVLVQIAYWPHPLIWLAGRAVRAVREQACDDLCVHGLGGPAPYRSSLLEVASGLIHRPGPSMGLAMARASNLGRRLAWIERTRGASRCLPRWPARLAVAVTVATAAGVLGSVELARATAKADDTPAAPAKEAEPQPAAQAGAATSAVEIIVRAKDGGRPLAGASVRPLIDHEQPLWKVDGEGRIRIDLSKRSFPDNFSCDVWAEGHVQQRLFFAENDARHPKLPGQVIVELYPGEQTLGGKVVDEQGRPIGGVRVKVWGYLGAKKQKDELAYMVDATTDDQGQWRCRCFRDMKFAYLYLSHPDYLPDDAFHPRRHGQPTPDSKPRPDDKPLEALRDFSDVQVLARGVEVAGEVLDERGRPVPGAEVGWLEEAARDTFHHNLPRTSTDPRGRFRFPHARPGKLVLLVQARGHAPGLGPVEGRDGGEPVAIELGPARMLAGRVVDSRGKPIAEAAVNVDTWRGYRALGVFLKTDSEGRFRWEDAPTEPVLLNANRAGFNGVFQRRVAPDEGEVLMTLKRSLSISGKILDAQTGKAVDRAQVEVGSLDDKAGAIRWGQGGRAFAMQGHLQADIDAERSTEFRLRIKAKGYQTFESRAIRGDEGQVEYDVKLVKADAAPVDVVSGVVLRPDGGPLEGAEVAVTYPLGGPDRLPTVQLADGKIATGRDVAIVKTDARGRFSLTREPDPAGHHFAVVVVHPDLYAEVPRAAFEAEPTIKARPWGRVEGVVRAGGKAAAGAEIHSFADRLGNRDVPYVSDSGRAKADAQGRYVLERVVPGDVRVARGLAEGSRFKAWSNGTLVEVRPGETARADVGGRGRPVIARIDLPEGFDPKDDYTANSEFEIESDRPNIPYPADLLAKRDGSMVDWGKRWWASAEGHAYRRSWFRHGQAKLQPDGTIRAEDVPPGEYRLRLTFSADPIRGPAGATSRIAYATKQFVIPEQGGDEPFDLGVLRPRLKQALKVGQPAPAFDVETLDGRRLKLEDFRGKYLLIDFWATWCGPCLAEIPEMKVVHDRFGKDERFAMLSFSLDARKEEPRKLVQDKGIAWPQGFLGEWTEGGVPEAYHVESIPSLFLIGSDGTLKAQGLRGDAIGAAVAQALKTP